MEKKKRDRPANEIVKYGNKLNDVIWHGLNLTETKLFLAIISRIASNAGSLNGIEFNFDYLKKLMNYTSHRSFSQYLWSLRSKVLSWREITEGSKSIAFVIFDYFEVDPDKQTVTIGISNKVTWLFKELQGSYTRYALRYGVNIDSVYGITLLRLLKQYRTQGIVTFTKDDNPDEGKTGLWTKLEVPDKYTEKTFSQNVLKPALIGIAPYFQKLNIKKNYGTKNKHRCVKSYTFTFTPESNLANDFSITPDIDRFVGEMNINSALCLTQAQKFTAIDKFLHQKKGTAKKKYKEANNVVDEISKKTLNQDNKKTTQLKKFYNGWLNLFANSLSLDELKEEEHKFRVLSESNKKMQPTQIHDWLKLQKMIEKKS